MLDDHQIIGEALVASMLGARAAAVIAAIDLDGALAHRAPRGGVSRICFAAALNAILFDDILVRVPTGAAFVADQRARGERIRFDHGALRTVRFPAGGTGALPAGQDAFARILGPLGYHVAGTYPLPRLKMTGRAWAHRDMPEGLPQFFVSELHVERFDPAFAMAAQRVFHASRDPLDATAKAVLARFERDGEVPFDAAVAALPVIVSAFDRQHPAPALDDYALLLDRSDEAAWIATEGNAFNHATSRVPDVAVEAERQRAAGLPVKERVEVSQTGRVRQTAFRADPVVRTFRDGNDMVARTVPGSFYEIIARDVDPATGRPDLSFDSGNATGIFAMTRAA
ncbi:2-oxoadipate dioxygenase/decarboxylase family protein [Rhizorhabdus histidinilytica]|uniref:2-oxoadipate dioxygenase/decarboxylase family protein n=1 Tax=Rhizorhabdus histidinilytica TaxID=439228 RepID=UPI00321F8D91